MMDEIRLKQRRSYPLGRPDTEKDRDILHTAGQAGKF